MPAAKDDVVVISSSEDEDSKPTASKAKPKVAAKPAVKRKSRVVDTESEAEAEQTAEESAEEEEKSAKKKKVSVAKVGAKVTAKAPVKKPPVKRAKKEDAGPKKEEWQFVPDTTGNGEAQSSHRRGPVGEYAEALRADLIVDLLRRDGRSRWTGELLGWADFCLYWRIAHAEPRRGDRSGQALWRVSLCALEYSGQERSLTCPLRDATVGSREPLPRKRVTS